MNREKRWSDLRKIDEDDQNDFKPNKIITGSQPLKTNFEIKGNRIVHFGSTLENGCTFRLEKPLYLSNATSEKQKGPFLKFYVTSLENIILCGHEK